jgi:hypothetical protein
VLQAPRDQPEPQGQQDLSGLRGHPDLKGCRVPRVLRESREWLDLPVHRVYKDCRAIKVLLGRQGRKEILVHRDRKGIKEFKVLAAGKDNGLLDITQCIVL